MFLLVSLLSQLTILILADREMCSDNVTMPEVECSSSPDGYWCPNGYDGRCENLKGTIFCCPKPGAPRVQELQSNGTVVVEIKNITISFPKVTLESVRKESGGETKKGIEKLRESMAPVKKPNNTVYKPRMSNPTLKEILSTTDILLPKITTTKPSELTISLSKTIIQGKCFDKYIYCREFLALCTHPTFELVMARKCALSCDRCQDLPEEITNNSTEPCEDVSSECPTNSFLCESPLHSKTMHEMCPKTCKICTPHCMDRHDNCASYKEEGFCENRIYSLSERQYLCGSSCNLCGRSN